MGQQEFAFRKCRLVEMAPGEEADFFALITKKESLTTRDGKPFFNRVAQVDRLAISHFHHASDSRHEIGHITEASGLTTISKESN